MRNDPEEVGARAGHRHGSFRAKTVCARVTTSYPDGCVKLWD